MKAVSCVGEIFCELELRECNSQWRLQPCLVNALLQTCIIFGSSQKAPQFSLR